MKLPGELRVAARSLRKSPVFFSVAVLSLALGIGGATAVFTLVDQVLLPMLPVHDPGHLVQLKKVGEDYGSNTGMNALSYPLYRDLNAQNQVFSGMLCRWRSSFSVSFNGRSEHVAGELVSGTYFPVLGLQPARGRLLTPEDDRASAASPAAVLSYDYWKTRFAGDPGIIGKDLVVNGHKLTVAGVAPKGFDGVEALFSTQIYCPMAVTPQMTGEDKRLENRRLSWLQVFGRLKPGITLQQARASMQPLFHRILEMEVQQPEFAHTSPDTRARFLKMTLDVMPGGGGQNVVKMFLETPLWAMLAMVSLVLLIACANVASLMIARASARRREMAVRLALGAGARRIVSQLLTESGVIALAGGLLGLALAPLLMRIVVGLFPDTDPPLKLVIAPDLRVLCFNLAVSLLTAVIFGLTPALQAARSDVLSSLKDEANAVAGGAHTAWRKALVVAEVALSLLLLIGSGLFVRSLQNLRTLSPGFQVTNLLSLQVDATLNGYKPEQATAFYRQWTDRLRALPGVTSAAVAVVPLLSFDSWSATITVEGHTSKPGEDMSPYFNYVSPGFFSTLKIPFQSGRDFTAGDTLGGAKVAVVNEKFARRFFGDRGAVGRHIGMGRDPGTKLDVEIIGVVGDTRYSMMREALHEQVFCPYLQNKWASPMTAYVRTDLGSAEMFPRLRGVVHDMDANLPVYQMKTLEHQRDDSLSVERFAADLSAAFGVLAALLAAIGLYGVIAFVVARRTREIGIRMALGASPGNVLWLVTREVLVLVAAGIVIGLPAAFAFTRLIASQLYEIAPDDPLTIIAATLGIVAVAALSGYLPAHRAVRVQPVTALRYE
jgi:predicted permease